MCCAEAEACSHSAAAPDPPPPPLFAHAPVIAFTLAGAGLLLAGASADGVSNVVTVAGDGLPGYTGDGGPASSARLLSPLGLAIDGGGNVFLSDGNSVIRRINTGGTISTFAGTGATGAAGDGGPALSAAIGSPGALSFDFGGNLYIVQPIDNRVRVIDPAGTNHTSAGNGLFGFAADGRGGPLAA